MPMMQGSAGKLSYYIRHYTIVRYKSEEQSFGILAIILHFW